MVRYSLYLYASDHMAIDCEDCGFKIANLKPTSDPANILTRINAHEVVTHGADFRERDAAAMRAKIEQENRQAVEGLIAADATERAERLAGKNGQG